MGHMKIWPTVGSHDLQGCFSGLLILRSSQLAPSPRATRVTPRRHMCPSSLLVRCQLSSSCLNHRGSSHAQVSTLRQLLWGVLQLPCRTGCSLLPHLGPCLLPMGPSYMAGCGGKWHIKASEFCHRQVRLNQEILPSIMMRGSPPCEQGSQSRDTLYFLIHCIPSLVHTEN